MDSLDLKGGALIMKKEAKVKTQAVSKPQIRDLKPKADAKGGTINLNSSKSNVF